MRPEVGVAFEFHELVGGHEAKGLRSPRHLLQSLRSRAAGGVCNQIMAALAADSDAAVQIIDTSVVGAPAWRMYFKYTNGPLRCDRVSTPPKSERE